MPPRTARLLAATLAALAPLAAYAQSMPPQPLQVPAPRAAVAQARRLPDRFAAANTTHDGRLTLAQAQAGGMPGVARNFDVIDADHKGFVTLADIRAFRRAHRAARQAQRPAPLPVQPPS